MRSTFAYINTRVSMLAARLLGRPRIAAWLSESGGDFPRMRGLDDLGGLLERGGGSTVLVEQALLSHLLEDLQVLIRATRSADRTFLSYSAHWFELGNLKALIRGKFAGLKDAEIRAHLLDTRPFASLPVDALLATENPAEMLRRLEQTQFADIARRGRAIYAERKDLFSLDAAIDRRYLVGLHQRAMHVHASQRHAVLALVGRMLDHFNLLWLLRLRVDYRFSPAEAFYLLVPLGDRLNGARLMSLAQLSGLEHIVAALPAALRRIAEGATTITDIENRLQAGNLRALQSVLRDMRFPLARAFAYMAVRDMEMRDMLAFIKGRNLGFAPELIRYATGISVR